MLQLNVHDAACHTVQLQYWYVQLNSQLIHVLISLSHVSQYDTVLLSYHVTLSQWFIMLQLNVHLLLFHFAYNITSSISSFVLFTCIVYSRSVYHPWNVNPSLVGSFNSTSLPNMNALGLSSSFSHPFNS